MRFEFEDRLLHLPQISEFGIFGVIDIKISELLGSLFFKLSHDGHMLGLEVAQYFLLICHLKPVPGDVVIIA